MKTKKEIKAQLAEARKEEYQTYERLDELEGEIQRRRYLATHLAGKCAALEEALQ